MYLLLEPLIFQGLVKHSLHRVCIQCGDSNTQLQLYKYLPILLKCKQLASIFSTFLGQNRSSLFTCTEYMCYLTMVICACMQILIEFFTVLHSWKILRRNEHLDL